MERAGLGARADWGVLAALGIYVLWGILLIAQKPGFEYDEALFVEGGVQLHNSKAEIALPHASNTWVCKFGRCFPLMGEGPYIGAVKDYFTLPFFAAFGSGAEAARLASMLLAMIGIWGVAKLVGEQVGRQAGACVALILAMNPAYVNATVFDNGVVAPTMAGFGLVCATLANYRNHNRILAALGFGAAAGLALWARANVIWTLAAGAGAAAIVFRRRLLIPASHCLAMAGGGIIGGFPLLYYQLLSKGGTLRAMRTYAAHESLGKLLPTRLFWLADTLLSDGEHRVMWSMRQLPLWQLCLFPIVVVAACSICVMTMRVQDWERWRNARFAALWLLLLTGLLLSSRLQIAEHHLIAIVPLAAVVVVLAGLILQKKLRWGWMVSAAIALVYVASGAYWQIVTINGLSRTGGIGIWSDASVALARYLEQEYPAREIKLLDWGLQSNLFVLMDGHLNSTQLFSDASVASSGRGRPWWDEIREGGVFLLTGTQNRAFSEPLEGFLGALVAARPVTRLHKVQERSGATYAEIVEIEPGAIRNPAIETVERNRNISMDNPNFEKFLSGFYEIQPGGWRWTEPQFSVAMDGPDLPDSPALLSLRLFIPPPNIEKLGSITLSVTVGDHRLRPETYSQSGQYTFSRQLPQDWMKPGLNRFDFRVDKHLGPSPEDDRELGIVVNGVSLEPQ